MKYYLYIFTFLCLSFSTKIAAQDTLILSAAFNKLYEDEDGFLSASGTQELEDGFLVCQTNYDIDSSCLEIMKIDHVGKIIWRRSVYCLENTADYKLIGTINGEQFIQSQDGNFVIVFGVVNDMDWGDSDVGILKMDAEANVLWLNIWEDDIWEDETNSPMAIRAIDTTSDGGLIATGVINHPNPHTAYVVKMDALGTIEWEWQSDKKRSYFWTVVENQSGEFLAAGYGEGSAFRDKDLYAVRLSPEGALLSEFHYPSKFDDISARIYLYPSEEYSENTYLLLGGVWDIINIAKPKKQYIALLDENLEVIWEKTHPSPISYYFGFTNAVINEDGSFVGCREYAEADTNGTALMWYDNQGELEKTILYPPPVGAIDIFTKSFKATSDGGYMIAGHIHSPLPQKTYILKLDTDGEVCAPENCIDLLEYEVINPEDTVDMVIDGLYFNNNSSNVIFYPNPAQDKIMFTYPHLNKSMTVFFYNILGQLVFQKQLEEGSKETQIDIKAFPKGLYHWSVMGLSGKLVVE